MTRIFSFCYQKAKQELLLVPCLCSWHVIIWWWLRQIEPRLHQPPERNANSTPRICIMLSLPCKHLLPTFLYLHWQFSRLLKTQQIYSFFPVQLICCLDIGLTSLCWKGFRCYFYWIKFYKVWSCKWHNKFGYSAVIKIKRLLYIHSVKQSLPSNVWIIENYGWEELPQISHSTSHLDTG